MYLQFVPEVKDKVFLSCLWESRVVLIFNFISQELREESKNIEKCIFDCTILSLKKKILKFKNGNIF